MELSLLRVMYSVELFSLHKLAFLSSSVVYYYLNITLL